MKLLSILFLVSWPCFQNSNHQFEQTLFTLSFEGVSKDRHIYRLKETILGSIMLNPIIDEFKREEDTNYLKLTVLLEGNLRDSVKVYKIKRLNKGIWDFLADNHYYYAEQFLGITQNGRIEIQSDEIKDLNLMFIDSDNCIPIAGLELSYSP